MKIKKVYQGELPENKILNAQSTSQTDTYSCEYINGLSTGGGGADKPFIQCGLTNNVSLSTTRVYLVFGNNIQRGDMFSVDADGGVRVNNDIEEGYLKLHFHTNINNTGVSVSNIACSIFKNTEEIISINNSLTTATSRCQLIGDVILNYKAGDVFKVRLVTADNTATALASLYRTLLILEKI